MPIGSGFVGTSILYWTADHPRARAAVKGSSPRSFDSSVMNVPVGSGLARADIDGDPGRRWVPLGRTPPREDLLIRSAIAVLARCDVQAPSLILRAAKVSRESADVALVARMIEGSTGIGHDPDAENGVDPTRQIHERSRAPGLPRNRINCSIPAWIGSPQDPCSRTVGRECEMRPWATLPNLPGPVVLGQDGRRLLRGRLRTIILPPMRIGVMIGRSRSREEGP